MMDSSIDRRFSQCKSIHIWGLQGTASREAAKANDTEISGLGDSGLAGTDSRFPSLAGPRIQCLAATTYLCVVFMVLYVEVVDSLPVMLFGFFK
jgi:hypothetical protein